MSSNFAFDLSTIREDGGDMNTNNRPSDLGSAYKAAPKTNVRLPSSQDIQFEQSSHYTNAGFEVAGTVVGNLIRQPCIVLRRQCQVNGRALRYHLSPFTLIPVVIRLHNRQGLKSLWKGAGGAFILRGIAVGIETVIAEVTPFPREISAGTSLKNVVQHLLLKSMTFGILTPFYCSSLIETVQSDIASEKPGVFDCLKEGVRRLFKWGTPQSTRLLPVWKLVCPTLAFGLFSYVLSSVVQYIFTWFMSYQLQKECAKHGAIQKKHFRSTPSHLNNLTAAYFGQMVAEILLFPAETVLNRLYLQGTRTIIDNLDSGFSVIPVITKYEGVVDCFHTIVAEEGSMGLYRGFGALVFEYSLQILLIKLATLVFQQISVVAASSKSSRTRI